MGRKESRMDRRFKSPCWATVVETRLCDLVEDVLWNPRKVGTGIGPRETAAVVWTVKQVCFLETIAFMGITTLLSTNVKKLAPDRYQQLIIRNVYFLWTCDATWIWAGSVLKQFGCNLLTRFTKSLLSFRLLLR